MASDAGPAPDRGIRLTELTSPTRSQLVRYQHGNLIQQYVMPAGAADWRMNRWVLHRSDTMSLTLKMLKKGQIRFPGWDGVKDFMQDILNVFIEVKQGLYREELFYRHKPDAPDDAMHALNWAVMSGLMLLNDVSLQGPSSSVGNGMADD